MRAFSLLIVLSLVIAGSAYADKPFDKPNVDLLTKQALDCTNAIDINCGDVYVGTTVDGDTNVTYYGCVGWNESGPEKVFRLTLADGACYTVTASVVPCSYPDTVDLDIFFLGSCDETDCLTYGNCDFTTPILFPGVYYIVVDGYYGDVADEFTLTVDCEVVDCPMECPCPLYTLVYDFNLQDYSFCDDCGGAATWMWGMPGGEYPAVPEFACDDVPVTNLLATTLGGDYPLDAGHRAILGPIDVTDETWCMEMCHYYDTETSFDGGNVKVSADGGVTWTLLIPEAGYPVTLYTGAYCTGGEPAFSGHALNSFIRDCFNLTQYIGSTVLLGFDFGSDYSVTYPGWYIKWVKFGTDVSATEPSSWGTIKSMMN
jgi:hypothetical protein